MGENVGILVGGRRLNLDLTGQLVRDCKARRVDKLRQFGDGVVIEGFSRHQVFGEGYALEVVARRRWTAAESPGIDAVQIERRVAFRDSVSVIDFDKSRCYAILRRGCDGVGNRLAGSSAGGKQHIDGALLNCRGDVSRIDL